MNIRISNLYNQNYINFEDREKKDTKSKKWTYIIFGGHGVKFKDSIFNLIPAEHNQYPLEIMNSCNNHLSNEIRLGRAANEIVTKISGRSRISLMGGANTQAEGILQIFAENS